MLTMVTKCNTSLPEETSAISRLGFVRDTVEPLLLVSLSPFSPFPLFSFSPVSPAGKLILKTLDSINADQYLDAQL